MIYLDGEMMTIEKVTTKDAKELLNIYAPYIEETAISFEYTVPSTEEFESRIAEILKKYPYIKAVESGEIVGYAYANAFKNRKAYDWSVETTIYVKKDSKRMGIGKALYESLETSLKEIGICNMNACIASPSQDIVHCQDTYLNDDSYQFHRAMGFSLVGRFHNSGYKFERWYDIIWMEKMIGNHEVMPKEVAFGKWIV